MGEAIDAIIIGGGWGGVCTMKHCLDEKIRAIVLEKSNDYGGVWNINNKPSVNANTYAVTSKYYLSMSDYPMPEDYPEFPHHTLVMEYMKMYAKHFDVEKHISLNSEVISIEKKEGLWHVQYVSKANKKTVIARHLAICTGQNSICKNYPDLDTSSFKGKVFHTDDYDETMKNECLNKRVLIYGGSDTSFDIGVELTNNMYAKKKDYAGRTNFGYSGPNKTMMDTKTIVYISMRKGRWIQKRTFGAYEPADMFYNRFFDTAFKLSEKSPSVLAPFTDLLQLFWGKSGSGVPEWETDTEYLNAYYVKSADILPKITFGEVTPLRDIAKVDATSIVTVDNERHNIDVILLATGYKGMSCYQFIPENIKKGQYYDHIFLIEDPSVVKVGFIRPYLTSIPMIIEMQSRYVAKVFANKVHLPSREDMAVSYEAMKKRQSIEFKQDYERVEGIIDPYDYMNMVSRKINAAPSLLPMLITDPVLLYYIITHSWSHFVYRLTDPDASKREIARHEITSLDKNGTSKKINKALHLLLFKIFFRIFLLILVIVIAWRNSKTVSKIIDIIYKNIYSKPPV